MEIDKENEIDEIHNEIEAQVIEKLKKVIKPKSEKQLAHIEKLAVKKRGSKYKKVESEPEIKKVKEKKPKKIIYVSESESEEEVVIVKKKPKTKKKAKVIISDSESEEEVVKKPRQKLQEQFVRQSYFNTNIC